GTTLHFNGPFLLTVAGSLLAEGTEQDSILFLPYENAENFRSISFVGTEEVSSRLSYVRVSGASWGALNIGGLNEVTINNCVLSDNEAQYGGGVYITNGSAPLIQNTLIQNNHVNTSGGGVYITASAPTFIDCIIQDNNSESWGGGVTCYNLATPTFENCTINNNECERTGGGMHISNASPILSHCLIRNNRSASWGGGVNCYNQANPTIEYSIFRGNFAENSGGGLYATGESSPEVNNCTFVHNDVGGWGSAVYTYANSTPSFHECIFANNTGNYGFYVNESVPEIMYSDFYNNAQGDLGGFLPIWLGDIQLTNQNGTQCDLFYNFFENPRFANVGQENFNLNQNSPCIDAGSLQGEEDPDGTLPDLGALFFYQENGGDPPPPIPEVLVTGTCILETRQQHDGIEIRFIGKSPSAADETAATQDNGFFSINLQQGLYDVVFAHPEFYPDTLFNQLILDDTNLANTLDIIGLSGQISGRWEAGTYIFDGESFVADQDTLRLEPGAVMRFGEGSSLTIHGYLEALGDDDNPIVFEERYNHQSWAGIRFDNTSAEESLLQHCTFRDADESAIRVVNSSIWVDECFFTFNLTNSQGAAIYIQNGDAIINECKFTRNEAGQGGAVYIDSSSVSISRSWFGYNYATEGGAICVFNSPDHISFQRNVFRDNTGERGAAIAIQNQSSLAIRHCTLYDNDTVQDSEGAISIRGASTALVSNCIFFNNGMAMYIDNRSDIDLEYSDFYPANLNHILGSSPPGFHNLNSQNQNGDPCDIMYNIFLAPTFYPIQNDSILLREGSPCIDAGNPETAFDPDDTIADLGAFYRDISLNPVIWSETAGNPEKFEIASLYPNPFNHEVQLSVALPQYGRLSIEIYNVLGQHISTLADRPYQSGVHHFQFSGENLSSGYYFIQVSTAGEQTLTQRIQLLK
ncbi:T9SS type A sorting domain-containing protein, partial [bacterium]|nr:T9SS type A sorting domain-containing protein [bacterium]